MGYPAFTYSLGIFSISKFVCGQIVMQSGHAFGFVGAVWSIEGSSGPQYPQVLIEPQHPWVQKVMS